MKDKGLKIWELKYTEIFKRIKNNGLRNSKY